jgi:hypothetical protein
MQLSKHFKLEEMTKSMTATRKGIDNSPGAGDIKNLENVCYEILEPFVHIFLNQLRLPAATVARRFAKRSAAKRHRSMQKARRSILKLQACQIFRQLTGYKIT